MVSEILSKAIGQNAAPRTLAIFAEEARSLVPPLDLRKFQAKCQLTVLEDLAAQLEGL